MKNLVLVLSAVIYGVGCAALTPFFQREYSVGEARGVTVGSVMVAWEFGMQNPVGKVRVKGYRKELIYGGIAQNVVQVSYREYSIEPGGAAYARPAFTQDLKYDLSLSKTISFQDIRIQVNSADQEKIVFIMLKEPDEIIAAEKATPEAEAEREFGSVRAPLKATLYFVKGDSLSTFIVGQDKTSLFITEDPQQPTNYRKVAKDKLKYWYTEPKK